MRKVRLIIPLALVFVVLSMAHSSPVCALRIKAEHSSQPPAKYDALRLKDETTLEVQVVRVEQDSIRYRLLDLSREYLIAKSRVLRIEYADGRVERMEASKPTTPEEDDWQSVLVTKEAEAVKGMRLVEKFDLQLQATSRSRRTNADELEAGATIQLQKKALQLRCTHLLIKEVQVMTSYGEPPSVRIIAEGYRKVLY